METVLKILFAPMMLFVSRPEAVFLVAGLFAAACAFAVSRTSARMKLGVVAGVWAAYGFWERYMSAWRSPSGDMAIRVDLLLIGPVVLFCAFAGVIVIANPKSRRPRSPADSSR